VRQLSISESVLKEPWSHTRFKTIEANSFRDVAKVILNFVWSPIIWRHGKRKTEYFQSCQYLVLDFDDGKWSWQDAAKWCEENNYTAIIGATRSHQKPKDGLPACDRFRVVVPLKEVCHSHNQLRQNMENLAKLIPIDGQCKDGARMYQPCTSILYTHCGVAAEFTPYIEPEVKKNRSLYHANCGILPLFIRQMMSEERPVGQRNKHCFRIAAKMAEMGFSEADCIKAVLACKVGLGEREKISAAKSGFLAGTRQRF